MPSFSHEPIPSWLAGISCVLFTVLFVGSLYVFPLAKVSSESQSSGSATTGATDNYKQQRLDRDHPLVIAQRFKGIALTMVLVPTYLWVVFSYMGVLPPDLPLQTRIGQFLRLLGLTLPCNVFQILSHLILPISLVAALFLGPLFMMFLSSELPFQQRFQWAAHWHELWQWIGMRNYIVGPISEEFIFRSCMVAIVAYSGASVRAMVFGLPLVFGIAHLHHGYESYVKRGRTRQALINSLIVALVQLTYTSLFGWFATFLFLRTSSLLGPCLSHSVCNIMGLPDLSDIGLYGHWKKWIYLMFVLGMILFGVSLGPLTNPSLYGDSTTCAYWSLTVN